MIDGSKFFVPIIFAISLLLSSVTVSASESGIYLPPAAAESNFSEGGAEILALPPNTVRIVSNSNGWCLTLSGGKYTLTDCNNLNNNQLFYYSYIGNSGGSAYYNIINYSNAECVQIEGGSYSDGAQLASSACCQQCTGQWWRQQDPGPVNGMYHLRNLPSGKCMDVPISGSVTNWTGEPMQQWSCGGSSGLNQYWVIQSY
jgi:hypothetical protein